MKRSIIFVCLMIILLASCTQSRSEQNMPTPRGHSINNNLKASVTPPVTLTPNPQSLTGQTFKINPTATKIPASSPTLPPTPTYTPVALSGLPTERVLISAKNIGRLIPLLEFNINSQISQVAWSPFSGEFAIGTMNSVSVYNPDTMQLIAYRDSSAEAIAFSPTQPILALGTYPPTLWNIVTGDQVLLTPDDSGSGPITNSMAFSPDGQVLATSAKEGTIELWDTNTGIKIRNIFYFGSYSNHVSNLVFTPDGKYLISSIGGSIIFWDFVTGEQVTGPSFSAQDIIVTDNSVNLLILGEGGISVWDITKVGQNMAVPVTYLYTIESTRGLIMFIAINHQDDLLFASSYAGELSAWTFGPLRETFFQKEHKYSIDSMALSEDGRTLITASYDGSVVMWGVTP